jgi:hypothetical protein
MQQWCDALQRDMTFSQQVDPLTGEFTSGGKPNYSPAALVMYDYTWRLAGVRDEGSELHWNVRPHCAASQNAIFRLDAGHEKEAEIRYSRKGARLRLGALQIGKVEGVVRVSTDRNGRPLYLQSIDSTPQRIELQLTGLPRQHFILSPNARESLVERSAT